MAIDERRHPHYGGRKRPAECDVCQRTLLCSQIDTPDDTGESVCPQCIAAAVDIAWSEEQRRPKSPAMWSYDDERCPVRGEGLQHFTDGRFNCVYCGVRLYSRRNTPGVSPKVTRVTTSDSANDPTAARKGEDCPKRGSSLPHRTEGGLTCLYCGVRVVGQNE